MTIYQPKAASGSETVPISKSLSPQGPAGPEIELTGHTVAEVRAQCVITSAFTRVLGSVDDLRVEGKPPLLRSKAPLGVKKYCTSRNVPSLRS